MQAVWLWRMVRDIRIPPMGGEGRWVPDWGAFAEAFRADHPLTWGFDRVEFYEAMFTCRDADNTDSKTLLESVTFAED